MGGGHTQIALKESLTSRILGGTSSTNRDHPPVPRQPSPGLGGFLSMARGVWAMVYGPSTMVLEHQHPTSPSLFPHTRKTLGAES